MLLSTVCAGKDLKRLAFSQQINGLDQVTWCYSTAEICLIH